METFRRTLAGIFLMFMVSFMCGNDLLAQGNQLLAEPANEGPSVVATDGSGFDLTKLTSNTIVPSGQYFFYSISATIPAGATSVVITDNLPPNLEFWGATYLAVCGSTAVPGGTAVIGQLGGTYTLSIPSSPTGCIVTINFTMRFPVGTTCDGETARNRICVRGRNEEGKDVNFCTEYVMVTATASDPWHVAKYILNTAYVGGPCPNATVDTVLTYRLRIWKNTGISGQLHLYNGEVRDLLPPGAILLSSPCAYQSGDTIIWKVDSLKIDPLNPNIDTSCYIQVLYPKALFPAGTNITNQFTLTGILGHPNKICGYVNKTSNQTCVTIKKVERGQFSKSVVTNGQPGCPGRYTIRFCNTGNVPLFSFNITDAIPAGIGPFTIAVSPGLTHTMSGLNLTATNTMPLNPGQCVTITINFTIPLTAPIGTTINNCATVNITNPMLPSMTDCAPFMVNAGAPYPCLYKQVCNLQPVYSPGQIVRYRLRVHNMGGTAITGATITDVLNPNLVYVGNPAFYTLNYWNGNCGTGSVWSGPTISASGNTVTVSNVTMPAGCGTGATHCGQTAGMTFYYVEFDVMITAGSALGSIPNTFRIGGGNLTGSYTSNNAPVLVNALATFFPSKGVRQAGSGAAFTGSLLAANPNLQYRVAMNITGSAALYHAIMADELPLNASPDRKILPPCSPRGSSFDITYAGGNVTSIPHWPYHMGMTTNPNVGGLSFVGVGSMFSSGCGINSLWTAGLFPVPAKNIAWYFGANAVTGPLITATFDATISPTAKNGDVSCNTVVANAARKFILNGTSTYFQKLSVNGLESAKNCVTLKIVTPPNCCENFYKRPRLNEVGVAYGPSVDTVKAYLSFNPNRPIRRAAVTIVSASRRFLNPVGTWQRILGDVTGATAIPALGTVNLGRVAPASSFTPPSLVTREIEWAANVSPAGATGPFNTMVSMVFPTAPNWPQREDLRVILRIEMTDTNCLRCDTIVELNLRNRTKYFKSWPDVPVVTSNTGITMSTRTNGILTISVPENETGEDDIQVVGVGIRANEATYATEFTSENGTFTPVPPTEGDPTLYCEGMLGSGQTTNFNISFAEPLADNWTNTLIVSFRLNGSEEIYSQELNVSAAAPVYGGGDKLEELASDLANVRTYALWFENANAAGHAIKNVQLHLPDGVNLLAYGSGLNNNQMLEATASFDADGNKIQNYLIPVQDADRHSSTVNPGETVTPIYITVSGGAEVVDLGFTTIDEGGSTMTNGTVQLTSPAYLVSGGQNDDGSSDNVQSSVPAPGIEEPKPSLIMNVYPNPATNSATINLGVESKETVSMTVSDIHGREVTVLCNESTLLSGNHIFTLNTTGLTDGTYLIVAKNQNGEVVTTQLKVVK